MATLNWNDYKELRRAAYRQGYGKEELKALPRLPNKNELMSMFQAIEDWFTTGFSGVPTTSLKAATEAGLGQSMPNPLVQKVTSVWFTWKSKKLLGG